MGPGTPKLFGRYLFVRNRLHDIRPGDEHVGAVLHHENEVCHRRAIDRATGARAHDHADLRDDARGHDVALKDLGITGEAVDTFLNARAAGIVKAYDRSSVLHRHIEDLADLLGVRLGHRSAQHGEVLAEDIDHAAIDGAPSRDDTVTGRFLVLHAEIGAAVRHEHVEFFKAALVQQQVDPFARCQLATAMLRVDALLPAAKPSGVAPRFEFAQNVLHTCPPGAGFASSIRGCCKGERKIAQICKLFFILNLQNANLQISIFASDGMDLNQNTQ